MRAKNRNEEAKQKQTGRWYNRLESRDGSLVVPGTEVASLSNLEAEAMDTLWDLNRSATAMEVLEYSLYKHRERGDEPISFPALQSTLRRLAEKGLLRTERDDYRTIRYSTLISREQMAARVLNNVSMKLMGDTLYSLLPNLMGRAPQTKTDFTPDEEQSWERLSAAIKQCAKVGEE
jgi:predicted transcriptional regulator